MECLDIVCPTTNVCLGVASRAEVIEQGLWCRSTNCFVLNSKGEVLCHQRSMEKERMPGVWSTHLGGHVASGESYESNVYKELEEEIGVAVPDKSIVAWRTTKLDTAHLWVREFVTLVDMDAEAMTPQVGEVDRLVWMTPKDILAAAQENPAQWCAGTHDFMVEYHCLRAAIAVAISTGIITTGEALDTWHPVEVAR